VIIPDDVCRTTRTQLSLLIFNRTTAESQDPSAGNHDAKRCRQFALRIHCIWHLQIQGEATARVSTSPL